MAAAVRLPDGVRAIGDLLFVDEYQVMSLEVLEPLVPRDRPESSGPREVQTNAGAAVADVNRRRARVRRLARRGLGAVPGAPSPNLVMLASGDGPRTIACRARRTTQHAFDVVE